MAREGLTERMLAELADLKRRVKRLEVAELPVTNLNADMVDGYHAARIGASLPRNLLAIDPQALLEDFEAVGDWTAGGGCALAANTSQYFSGAQSIQMTTASGTKGTMTKTVALNLYSLLNVRFWFHTPDLTKISSVGIVLGQNAAVTVAFEKYLGYGSPVNVRASHLQVNRADWTVWSADWANDIIRLRFSITPQAGQVAVGSFDYCTAGVIGAACAFVSFDDEHESVYEHAYPHMAANGQRGTIYTITDLVGNANKMTWTELQALDAAGWDIGNHTRDHTNLTTLTYAEQLAELQDAQDALDAQGLGAHADQVAYPYGAYNDDTLAAMAAAGMQTGRTVENAAPDILPFANPYRLQVYCYLTSTLSLAQAKAKVDVAKAAGAILSVLGHILVVSGPGANEWAIQDFRDLMDYIRDEGILCVTANDLYDLQSAAVVP